MLAGLDDEVSIAVCVGEIDGCRELLGSMVGLFEGSIDDRTVGIPDGAVDGSVVGDSDGKPEGVPDGRADVAWVATFGIRI